MVKIDLRKVRFDEKNIKGVFAKRTSLVLVSAALLFAGTNFAKAEDNGNSKIALSYSFEQHVTVTYDLEGIKDVHDYESSDADYIDTFIDWDNGLIYKAPEGYHLEIDGNEIKAVRLDNYLVKGLKADELSGLELKKIVPVTVTKYDYNKASSLALIKDVDDFSEKGSKVLEYTDEVGVVYKAQEGYHLEKDGEVVYAVKYAADGETKTIIPPLNSKEAHVVNNINNLKKYDNYETSPFDDVVQYNDEKNGINYIAPEGYHLEVDEDAVIAVQMVIYKSKIEDLGLVKRVKTPIIQKQYQEAVAPVLEIPVSNEAPVIEYTNPIDSVVEEPIVYPVIDEPAVSPVTAEPENINSEEYYDEDSLKPSNVTKSKSSLRDFNGNYNEYYRTNYLQYIDEKNNLVYTAPKGYHLEVYNGKVVAVYIVVLRNEEGRVIYSRKIIKKPLVEELGQKKLILM